MKISPRACLVLLTAGVYGAEVLQPVIPQSNFDGWVNPEDLAPMPQCIAQQDHSTWLDTMTKCTSKRCTSHFGIICTHHQWLTELTCLSIGFSPELIEGYLPYCGRSVLAKAQLYLWIRKITGRTWLVDVGDANGLQDLSPASLAQGYAAVDVAYSAPTCLTDSVSPLSMEPFQHVMASCSFTSATQHTGNAARPWEYRESLRSMVALDFETVGYDLAGGNIGDGEYFDKECFCNAFTIDPKEEPCPRSGLINFTKERLWINATCGPNYLPDNPKDILKTTEFAYVPVKDWTWPKCVANIPKQVIELTDQCATDACEIDSSGYCIITRAVDRTCFCRDVSYDSPGGSCHIFETRIDYIKWLHDLCGNVPDWHGLPDDWRQLAAPTPLDMIPWRWTAKPSDGSNNANITRLGSIGESACASNQWKLGSLALVNVSALLSAFLSQRISIHGIARGFLWPPHPWSLFSKGALIAALHLLGNWFNAFLVQKSPGYQDVPIIQLMLFWSSIPRLAWITVLLIGVQPFEAITFSAATSSLFAEIILQFISSYYMLMTVGYGLEHSFYFGRLGGVERGTPAKLMYAGALMWLITVGITLVQLMRATRRMTRRCKQTTFNNAGELIAQLDAHRTILKDKLAHCGINKSRDSEETPLGISGGTSCGVYGTFSVKGQHNRVSQKSSVELYTVMVISMLLLWTAQWLFWGGFIGLSSEEFCPPDIRVLTAVWVAFSLAGAAVGAS